MAVLLSKLGIVFTLIALGWLDGTSVTAKQQVKIGAIFPDYLSMSEVAFKAAIRRANIKTRHIELHPRIKNVPEFDSYRTEIAACELLNEGVAAIFGPSSNITSGIVDSICNNFNIPHIMNQWSYDSIDYRRIKPRNMTLNVHPDSDKLAEALADIIKDYSWKSYTIIYDTDENLIRLKNVIGLHGPRDLPISVVQLDVADSDYRPKLKKIHYSTEPYIIISVESQRIMDVLFQAQGLNMLDDYRNYFLVPLDSHNIDLTKELGEIASNITSVRLIDTSSDELENFDTFLRNELLDNRMPLLSIEDAKKVYIENALYYDAVLLFSQGFDTLSEYSRINTVSLHCNERREWREGLKIATFLKHSQLSGVTGPLRFDSEGKRTGFGLDIIEFFQKKNEREISESGYKVIAKWDEVNHVNYTRSFGELEEEKTTSLTNKTFIVVSRFEMPFLMERQSNTTTYEGNNRYEGYAKDLMDAIFKEIKSNYRFEILLPPENTNGAYDKKTKKWSGLMGRIVDRRADLAICDLTITHERRTAVDFTLPFMTLGISILYSVPHKDPPEMFSFLQPLSNDVWICTAAAYLSVSLLIFILARMASREWEDPHPCKKDSEERENIWNIMNSVWLSMGSVMGQGSDLLPKANSTRLVAGMWYFFALIMLASYTANLAAFLTMERMEPTIESAEDLAKQNKIKYGVVKGGSTAAFFRDSNHTTYKRMWAAMENTQPSVFVTSNEEGKNRVLNKKDLYAFFMESTMIEFITERHCNLTQVGGLLDSKGYGIAMPKDSPYRKAITGAILKLQEEGVLHNLKTEWWKKRLDAGKCVKDSTASAAGAAELGVANVGGVFLLVGFGIGVGFILAILEFLWNVRRLAVRERVAPQIIFMRELKFALKFSVRVKPVQYTNSGEDSPLNRSRKSLTTSEEIHNI